MHAFENQANFYYKVGQRRPLFTPDLPCDTQFTLVNFWKVEPLLESKERKNPAPPQPHL